MRGYDRPTTAHFYPTTGIRPPLLSPMRPPYDRVRPPYLPSPPYPPAGRSPALGLGAHAGATPERQRERRRRLQRYSITAKQEATRDASPDQ
jgi:hypothetical protein